MPSPRLEIVRYVLLFVLLAGLTIAIAIYFTGWQSKKSDSIPGCGVGRQIDHQVVIQYGRMDPGHTDARRCDKLTILNLDDKSRLMAFGKHDKHVTYDGMEEQLLTPGRSLNVTLNQTGQFKFHDHFDDRIQGTFTVTP